MSNELDPYPGNLRQHQVDPEKKPAEGPARFIPMRGPTMTLDAVACKWADREAGLRCDLCDATPEVKERWLTEYGRAWMMLQFMERLGVDFKMPLIELPPLRLNSDPE